MEQINKQKIQEENEQKKKFLKSYLESVRRLNRIQAELSEVRSMRASISVSHDGMPHGGGQGDLSGYVAELDGLERELMKERYNRIRLYKDIAERIKAVKNSYEQDVLFYRYIKGLDWWEIAEKMNYTERWIHKLHGRALAHLELPKEFIEIQ